jgi:hypothetical protein
MLVLAMEFSRCAQRALRTVNTKEQTGVGVQSGRASGRRPHTRWGGGIASEGLESPRAARRAGTEGHSLKTE